MGSSVVAIHECPGYLSNQPPLVKAPLTLHRPVVAVHGDEVLVPALSPEGCWPGWLNTASGRSRCSTSPGSRPGRCNSRRPAIRFAFPALPAAGGGALTPRPVVDISLEGLADARIECLCDADALQVPGWARDSPPSPGRADRALDRRAPPQQARNHRRALARVDLAVADGRDPCSSGAAISFCAPGPRPWPRRARVLLLPSLFLVSVPRFWRVSSTSDPHA